MSKLELTVETGTKDDREQAMRYYSALRSLSVSTQRNDVYLFLTENKMRLQDEENECEDATVLRWYQGAIQIIDSFLDHVDNAGTKMQLLKV